jgi:hypothetical protein
MLNGFSKMKGDVRSGTTQERVCPSHVDKNLLKDVCIDYHFAKDDVGEFLKF